MILRDEIQRILGVFDITKPEMVNLLTNTFYAGALTLYKEYSNDSIDSAEWDARLDSIRQEIDDWIGSIEDKYNSEIKH